MAGTATWTPQGSSLAGYQSYAIAWTANGSGAVSGNPNDLKGVLLRSIKFVPGAGGAQPSDAYDVQLLDADGVDLLDGEGADRSNATGSLLSWDPPLLVNEPIDLVIANAGNAKSGTVTLWVQDV